MIGVSLDSRSAGGKVIGGSAPGLSSNRRATSTRSGSRFCLRWAPPRHSCSWWACHCRNGRTPSGRGGTALCTSPLRGHGEQESQSWGGRTWDLPPQTAESKTGLLLQPSASHYKFRAFFFFFLKFCHNVAAYASAPAGQSASAAAAPFFERSGRNLRSAFFGFRMLTTSSCQGGRLMLVPRGACGWNSKPPRPSDASLSPALSVSSSEPQTILTCINQWEGSMERKKRSSKKPCW